ncbi:hypothetical protein D3C85_1904820 [compost metagenome]
MTEQFGLHQAFGERAAVDRDKRIVAPGAEVVQVTGHQFLAGAGFADDQHAGITGGDLLQVRQQCL